MECPRDGERLEVDRADGEGASARCPRCGGLWGTRAALEARTGGPLRTRATSLELLDDDLVASGGGGAVAAARCLACRAPLAPEESRAAPAHEVLACHTCGRAWLDGALVEALAASRAETAARATRLAEARRETLDALAADVRARHGGEEPAPTAFLAPPLVELVALPTALAVAWAFVSTSYGELLAFVPSLQFHELGHALAAWWTGRRALPLPIGFTFWSLERSWALVSLEALFAALLATYGVRERKPVAVGIAAAMLGAVAMGVLTPFERTEAWVIAAGGVGELLLPALVVAAFHVPMPRRVRWDFWRWIVGLVAMVALAFAVRAWWQIQDGDRPLPYGSFLSGRDSSDGDLNRLVDEHGWTEASLRTFFGRLATLALALALVPHTLLTSLRAHRAHRR